MTDHVTLSVITAIRPAQLSKTFTLNPAGELVKSPGGIMVQGSIETRTPANLMDLAAILQSLTPSQALVYGVPIKAANRVMTRRDFAAAGNPEGVTTRTNDSFSWPKGPGVLMLDYDPPAGGVTLDRDKLVQAIREAAPGLAEATMLWWPSASSCIWAGEKELRGIRGQRLYLLVLDAEDIPRAGAMLVKRLWLAGLGRIDIGISGSLLERTLVDGSVWQSSRMDFAGGAACGPGLEQRRGDPVIISGSTDMIDSRLALPDLSADEQERLAQMKAEEKAAVQPEAYAVRDAWITARVQEMVPPEAQSDPKALEAAETIARRALEASVLAGDFVLQVEVGGKIMPVKVSEVFDNRERWHGCRTRDPLEPGYDGGRLVGQLYLLQARPSLHSFVHGGKTYRLHRAPARIELVKGHTAEAAGLTIDLLRRDPMIFDFGGQLVLADEGRIHPLCEHALAHHLSTIVQYWKWTQQDGVPVKVDCDPPSALLKQVIAEGERRKLKPLDGIITGPTIRLDGSILATPGYDAATRLLFDSLGDDVPDVQTYPTLDQAHAALNTLLLPFENFPFINATAKGVLLAAILTAVVRLVLPTAPAFAFDAPVQGSGKTLLAKCIGAIFEGGMPDIWPHTQGRDDEETRKRLFTALRTGRNALIWDNITGVFDSAAMAGFITADVFSDRVLGKSEAIRIPNRALLILTGNNLSLAGDLPRRVIICRIDPKTDQPFARQFDMDPLQYVLEHRLEIIAAACTLIRARFTHMKQPAHGRLASFEDWDDLVRQTVVWVDTELRPSEFGDPMDLVREAQAADPEAEALFALLNALHAHFGDAAFSARDIQAAANEGGAQSPLAMALRDLAGDHVTDSVKSLGRVLKHREGRIVQGLRLSGRLDMQAKVNLYTVMATDTGFAGFTGFLASHTEKGEPSSH